MQLPKLRQALLLIGLASLTSCAAGNSEPALNPCGALTVKTYTAEQQKQVADEIDGAPVNTEWPSWIRDYGASRAEIRACKGAK